MADPVTVRDTAAMIAGMAPQLQDGSYIFCSIGTDAEAARYVPHAIATFREREGLSLLLPIERAAAFGFDCALPMRHITLTVFSALDGVGLTAAVSAALARHGIACNMVAAHHHDHVFVPASQATAAMAVLAALADGPPGG
jgi:uncharacterized protein